MQQGEEDVVLQDLTLGFVCRQSLRPRGRAHVALHRERSEKSPPRPCPFQPSGACRGSRCIFSPTAHAPAIAFETDTPAQWVQQFGRSSARNGVRSCKTTFTTQAEPMSRPLRVDLAGGLYHVTSRGDGRDDS